MLFHTLESIGLRKLIAIQDQSSGLRALIAIDDTTLGPAAGGVRTMAYPDEWAALRDAAALARTMTLKCALADLPCGGGKAVVLDHPGLDRPHAFEVLGAAVESLGGLFRTAGDLGTHEADLRAMERRTRYVHLDAQGLDLTGTAARGVLLAMREGLAFQGTEGFADVEVVVQGIGAIGEAVARELVDAGARVTLADVDVVRAADVAAALGATVVDASEATRTVCDVFSPCATGGVIDEETARTIPCRVVCGSANNPLTSDAVAEILEARGVLYVPDFVANAGAVIEGIGASMLGLEDRTELIDRIAVTTRTVVEQARARGVSTVAMAKALAQERIEEAMPKWRRRG
jgi:leucine dehydrogenase